MEVGVPLVSVRVAHGRTLEEARRRLETAVQEVSDRLGVRSVEWSADRSRVKMEGLGAQIEMWVDTHDIYLTGDLPGLGALLSGPLTASLKQIIQQTFRKQLP